MIQVDGENINPGIWKVTPMKGTCMSLLSVLGLLVCQFSLLQTLLATDADRFWT
jgi:hypothetical protein